MKLLTTRTQSWAERILLILPALSLILMAVAWLRHGLDLPFYDDWRGYVSGNIHSLKLAYLFGPVNDTLSPVGLALDALAQRYLDGNSLVYQLLSMLIVLGGLLYLQWRLLSSIVGTPWIVAVAFVSTLLMLQPGSYWGRENLAYHQALPLLFMLTAFLLALSGRIEQRWRPVAILALGLLAGFSYISGAFAALVGGVVLVCSALLLGDRRERIAGLRNGAALTLGGTIATAAQLITAVLPYAGAAQRPDAPMAFPWQADYWFFLLGKVGRALLLPHQEPLLSMALAVLVCALVLLLAALLTKRLWALRGGDARLHRLATVYLALCAIVFVYLQLVAAGRTNLRPAEITEGLAIFAFGFQRFHFFWATLLWPWLIAALLYLLESRGHGVRFSGRLAVALGFVIVAFAITAGAFSHTHRFKEETYYRLPTITCLAEQLQRGQGIYCHEFNVPDFTPAYEYGRKTGASFVRYFPLLPVAMGTDDPAPLFRLSRDTEAVTVHSAQSVAELAGVMQAGEDPQVHILLNTPEEMASCRMLDVNLVIATETADSAQLFFRPRGMAEYTEQASQWRALDGSSRQQMITFRLESREGFEGVLRFDPVTQPQKFLIEEMEVRCRMRASP